MSSARRVAATVLRRVWEDGAYAAAALSAELDRTGRLDVRDRALATELVYGVLRTENSLLERLSRHGRIRRKDTELTVHLLIGAYQLAFLDRVPQRAAVHQAVEEVRRVRGARVGGFANAVLRKVAAEGPQDLGDAIYESAPRWLTERLVRAVGETETRVLLGAVTKAPGLGLRSRTSVSSLSFQAGPSFQAEPLWPQAGAGVVPSDVTPGALRYCGGGDPRQLPGYAQGAFVVQEEGAQLVTRAVGARPGERVLDACAGRGQKASLLAERLGTGGELWATDLHPGKLEQLRVEFQRLRLDPPRTAVVDWTRPVLPGEGPPGGFDRVLVDVPCAGDGTLRRRPEIARRLGPEDPARLTEVQRAILRAAAAQARPGGQILYATCSVLREACEDVIKGVGDLLELCPFDAPEVEGVFSRKESSLRLLPGRHGTDGYFVASLRRR